MIVVDTVGGNVVADGLVTRMSDEVEFDVRVPTMGVFELFIIDTVIEPESPAKTDTVHAKENAVVVQVPAGLVDADPGTTDNGSRTLSVATPATGENERANIGIRVIAIPMIPILLLVNWIFNQSPRVIFIPITSNCRLS